MTAHTPEDLQRIYGARFCNNLGYRKEVWDALVSGWFGRYVPSDADVLDLGSGYGEFINTVRCRAKYAMDLNPDALPRWVRR